MQYRLVFIGIDQYADSEIRELSGAVNDARALWALFADTFPTAQSDLLTNELAVRAAVVQKLNEALLNAQGDDVAVVFFGGHGTRDQQLVLHDSLRNELSATTIAMQDIADLFRRTRARAALLVLDCCFSGGVT